MLRKRWLVISLALIWLGFRAYTIAHEWSNERFLTREHLILSTGESLFWGREHPACRKRFGFWPDGTRIDDSELDPLSSFLSRKRSPSDASSAEQFRERIARNQWAANVRAKIASCEEAQWMPIAKAEAIKAHRTSLLADSIIPPIIALLLFYGSMWIWKRFGATSWLSVPENLRRGILRLYLASAIPWILWFAYKIYDDNQHHPRYVERDILWLFSMPLGTIVLFMIGGWIVDGFRVQPLQYGAGTSTPRGTISDFQSILESAILKSETNNPHTREQLYERARSTLLSTQFADDQQRNENASNLEAAIRLVEQGFSTQPIATKGSTALLLFTIFACPLLWVMDFTNMSIWWIARPRQL